MYWAVSSQLAPPRMAVYSLTGNASSPFQAEPPEQQPPNSPLNFILDKLFRPAV